MRGKSFGIVVLSCSGVFVVLLSGCASTQPPAHKVGYGWEFAQAPAQGPAPGTAQRITTSSVEEPATNEQAIIAYLRLENNNDGSEKDHAVVETLQQELITKLSLSGVGQFHGGDRMQGFANFYMYGPDADKLADAVLPVLKQSHPRAGSYLLKRYGPPGTETPSVRVSLSD